MGNKNISELGKNTRFSSENQPKNKGNRKGKRNKATIARAVLAMPSDVLDGAGIRITDPDTGETIVCDLETAMALRIAAKAISKGDAYAYAALMDCAYGRTRPETAAAPTAPKTDIDLSRLTDDELITFKKLLDKAKGIDVDGSNRNGGIEDAEILQ